MESDFNELINHTIQRYSDRYNKLGYNVKTLGWGTKEQQEYRFSQSLISEIDFKNKDILDIGCGFGDYYNFLTSQNVEFKKYYGYDLNPDLISEANKRFSGVANAEFKVSNLFETNDINAIADIGTMYGLLNLNWKEKYNNLEYSKRAIANAFKLVREVLIVDFLSTEVTPDYPMEDFVYYHNPGEILKFAFTLSSNVLLKHNYAPIPQKEFMIFIFK